MMNDETTDGQTKSDCNNYDSLFLSWDLSLVRVWIVLYRDTRQEDKKR